MGAAEVGVDDQRLPLAAHVVLGPRRRHRGAAEPSHYFEGFGPLTVRALTWVAATPPVGVKVTAARTLTSPFSFSFAFAAPLSFNLTPTAPGPPAELEAFSSFVLPFLPASATVTVPADPRSTLSVVFFSLTIVNALLGGGGGCLLPVGAGAGELWVQAMSALTR